MGRASDDNLLEWAADVAAAAVLAAAVGFAAGAAGLGAVPTIFAAVAASVGAFTVLRTVSPANRIYDLPSFELALLELTQEVSDELVLDDTLETVPPGARVVRLFDPSLESRSAAGSGSAPPDAAQALTEALAELRRSLR